MSCSCDNNPLILPVGATGPQGPQGEPGFGFEHFVGEEFGGGVVFHVYRDADGTEHGLIISLEDQVISPIAYSNITSTSLGIPLLESKWNGAENTNLMEAQVGASAGAWKACVDYTYDGFTDWYLPSISELILLSNNRFNVNKTFSTVVGATELLDDFWWSSTEFQSDSSSAKIYNMLLESIEIKSKNDTYRVRAIRKY